MKLRNKKTGEVVVEINKIGLVWNKYGMPAEIGQYDSIAELCEEWEDYVPKEPLIKDEDARDALYSWASKLQIHQVRCKIAVRGLGVVVTTFEACSLHSAPIIEFTSLYANVVHGGFYTIEELCGTPPEPIEPTFIDLDERIKEKEEE